MRNPAHALRSFAREKFHTSLFPLEFLTCFRRHTRCDQDINISGLERNRLGCPFSVPQARTLALQSIP